VNWALCEFIIKPRYLRGKRCGTCVKWPKKRSAYRRQICAPLTGLIWYRFDVTSAPDIHCAELRQIDIFAVDALCRSVWAHIDVHVLSPIDMTRLPVVAAKSNGCRIAGIDASTACAVPARALISALLYV
jgi:hypothetical protein